MRAPEVVEAFRGAIERNVATVYGPFPASEAAETVVARTLELAGDGPVAVPGVDGVLERAGVFEALRAEEFDLVRPGDDDWRRRISVSPVGVTGSVAGAAETGSVAVECGRNAPRAVSLVPEAHLCVLPASRIFVTLEEAFAAALDGDPPPQLVWISGVSRSADIEKRITLGVHGPRVFEVVLIDDGDGDRRPAG